MTNTLRKMPKDGKYDYDGLNVVLSMNGIMGFYQCIA